MFVVGAIVNTCIVCQALSFHSLSLSLSLSILFHPSECVRVFDDKKKNTEKGV